MIDVYYAAPSIYGRKVLAVLDEKNLDYTIKSVEWGKFQEPEYLKLNPNAEVPTIVDDGQAIYESSAIVEYLNDEYPEPALLPEDSAARAAVRIVAAYCDLHFYRALIKIVLAKKAGTEMTAEMIEKVSESIKRLEAYLGTQEFIAGKFSIADCAVMAGLSTVEALGLTDKVGITPKLRQYWDRLKRRPGYKGASLFTVKEAAPVA